MNGAGTGKGGGDAFASVEDILCEETMEGGKERLITVEDRVKTRGGKWGGFAYGRDDGCENGGQMGKQVGEVDVSD